MAKVKPADDEMSDDDDEESIPSVSTVDTNEEEEAEGESFAEGEAPEKSWGGRRGAAGAQEARDALGAWQERPEPRVKQVIEDYKYPCYDFRWFIGCCIYYPVEDTVILGDMELVITTVKRMKRKYPDEWMKRINVRHDKYGGHTITSLAILEKRNDIAEWLIENGLDIDQRDAKTGLAPLHHAVRQQCLTDKFKSTIDALIEYGCEIDIRDKRGATPLMLACLFGNVDLVKQLLEEGADLETRDKDGWRPLNYAAFGGRIDAAKLLVSDRGASTDLKDKRSTISEDLVSYLFEYEGSRQRHGEVVSYLEAYKPTVT